MPSPAERAAIDLLEMLIEGTLGRARQITRHADGAGNP